MLLVAIAIWEIVATVRAPAEVPDDRAWDRAAAAVRSQHHPGDLIVFAPGWIDPVGRLHLGDLIPLEMAGRMDGDDYGTIWELSIRGARAPETAGLAPAWQGGFGGVTVRRFEREPAHVVSDLVALAGGAELRGAGSRPAVQLAEVGFAPHRCAQVIPAPGQAVTLDFGRIPLGTRLVAYAGLADVFTRRDVRDPGRLEIRIDGEVVADARLGVDDGWVRMEAATTPGEHDVEVIAEAVGPKARDRRICFAAEARR
ncbi:MAG: hypothetical protein H6709_15215 [Kofleriaceae bacterium]|nr:hypothetical protein [Kofleriaceae bacterium]